MADWAKPTITSNYIVFVDEVKARDIDAITLQLDPLTNPPTGAIKLVRAPVKFQEWNGTVFVDRILTIDGGGTGSGTAAGARTALGLGTMAVQNSNAISVTGGSIANINSSGGFGHNGSTFQITTTVATQFTGAGSAYAAQIIGHTVAGSSNGLLINAGTGGGDSALQVASRDFSRSGFGVSGDMIVRIPWRLVIPVGANRWA